MHADPSFENVAEFRHSSWWKDNVIKQLGERQIGFCGMSHPDFPNEVIGNTQSSILRDAWA